MDGRPRLVTCTRQDTHRGFVKEAYTDDMGIYWALAIWVYIQRTYNYPLDTLGTHVANLFYNYLV